MPALVLALLGGLIQLAGSIAGRVLIALGISIATMTGVGASLDWATSYITGAWSGLPPQALQLLSTLRVGQDIGILVGAILAKFALKGLSSDSVSFWVMRGRVG